MCTIVRRLYYCMQFLISFASKKSQSVKISKNIGRQVQNCFLIVALQLIVAVGGRNLTSTTTCVLSFVLQHKNFGVGKSNVTSVIQNNANN